MGAVNLGLSGLGRCLAEKDDNACMVGLVTITFNTASNSDFPMLHLQLSNLCKSIWQQFCHTFMIISFVWSLPLAKEGMEAP